MPTRSRCFRLLLLPFVVVACAAPPTPSGPVAGHPELGTVQAMAQGIAEGYAKPVDRGLWVDEDSPKAVRAWVDFAVANWAYHKRLAVEIRVLRANGLVEHTLAELEYAGALSGGLERWRTDLIAVYPSSPHHGDAVSVDLAFRVLADSDEDGVQEVVRSQSVYRLADAAQLADPQPELGAPDVSGVNEPPAVVSVDTAAADQASAVFEKAMPPVEVYFAPYDDPEQVIRAEIDAVIEAAKADPDGVHTIHAAIFDINDPRIVNRLLAAHSAGVQVRLLTAAYHMNPHQWWETEYHRLQAAGVEVVGVHRDRSIAASMHTKFAIFDGQVVTTGSYNWERGSADDNAENLVVVRSPELAAVYERHFQAIAVEPCAAYPIDPIGPLSVYGSQQHAVRQVLYDEIEAATQSVHVAMFTLRHLPFADDDGVSRDVLDALIDAVQRGVHVSVLLERNTADEGEYYGTITPDDPTDEWLAAYGVDVTKIHTERNGNPYASMHHKFAVIDEVTTLTGSYNWFSASDVSDDDLVVIRDPAIAARFRGEITNLRRHFDPDFDPAQAPSTLVHFDAYNAGTSYGDTVVVVGDIPELGSWDPSKGVALNPADWPQWKAAVPIPSGTFFRYKLVTHDGAGCAWESGGNRSHTADPLGGPHTLTPGYHHDGATWQTCDAPPEPPPASPNGYIAPLAGLPKTVDLNQPLQVLFTPDEPALALELGLIARVRAAAALDGATYADGENPHRIRYAVYNLTHPEITKQLADAADAGVDVQLLVEADKLDPDKDWLKMDDYLVKRGFELVADHHALTSESALTADLIGIADNGLMHLKARIFETPQWSALLTGSHNPQNSAMSNDETLHLVREPALIAEYIGAYNALRAGQSLSNTWDEAAPVNVLFTPAPSGLRAGSRILQWLEEEDEQILLMMFALRDISAPGDVASLVELLAEKVQAGVDVLVITDRKMSDGVDATGAAWFWDNGTDDALRAAGVPVYEVMNLAGPHTAMHAKAAILGRDGGRVITDAANWSYSGLGSAQKTAKNVESVLFIDSAQLDDGRTGRRYLARWLQLLATYEHQDTGEALGYDAVLEQLSAHVGWPSQPVRFVAHEAYTQVGEEIEIRGDRPELGGWKAGFQLDTSGQLYPTWSEKAAVVMPLGACFRWKLVAATVDGSTRWESGADRESCAGPPMLTPADELKLSAHWR